jgi:hypothetical protein
VHNGVTVIPQKGTIEFYATDSTSIARTLVKEKADKDLPRFVAPWALVDRLLELAEPDSSILVFDDCLVVEAKRARVCSNLLELPEEPDLPRTLAPHIADADDTVVELPTGLQSVLDRVVILAGQEDEAIVNIATDGKALVLQGKYGLGHLDETLPLKAKASDAAANFPAHRVRRGISQAKSFMLSAKALVLDDGEDFIYLLSAKHATPASKRGAKSARADQGGDNEPEEDTGRKPIERRRVRGAEEEPTGRGKSRRSRGSSDDEIPF